jgi:hypothetical protein
MLGIILNIACDSFTDIVPKSAAHEADIHGDSIHQDEEQLKSMLCQYEQGLGGMRDEDMWSFCSTCNLVTSPTLAIVNCPNEALARRFSHDFATSARRNAVQKRADHCLERCNQDLDLTISKSAVAFRTGNAMSPSSADLHYAPQQPMGLLSLAKQDMQPNILLGTMFSYPLDLSASPAAAHSVRKEICTHAKGICLSATEEYGNMGSTFLDLNEDSTNMNKAIHEKDHAGTKVSSHDELIARQMNGVTRAINNMNESMNWDSGLDPVDLAGMLPCYNERMLSEGV